MAAAWVTGVSFVVAACCYALLGILSQLSKEPDGSYPQAGPGANSRRTQHAHPMIQLAYSVFQTSTLYSGT